MMAIAKTCFHEQVLGIELRKMWLATASSRTYLILYYCFTEI